MNKLLRKGFMLDRLMKMLLEDENGEPDKSILGEDGEVDKSLAKVKLNGILCEEGFRKGKKLNIYESLRNKLFDVDGFPTHQTQVAVLHAIAIVTDITDNFKAKEMFLEDGETLMKWPPYQYIYARFEGYMNEIFNFNAKCGKFETREVIIKRVLGL